MKLNDEMKTEIKKITSKIIPKIKRKHGEFQMNLGSLIKALSKERTGLPVYIEFPAMTFGSPGVPHSYYGYHSDLAFEPTTKSITVSEFLEICEHCIGKSLVAPDDSHGGFYRDYTMQATTPCWISKLDSASNLGIVDVVSTVDSVTLKTKEIKEEEDSDVR